MKKMNEIKPAKGSTSKRKRVGRGNASGFGGECGRGHKGQKSRSGFSRKPGFEGGQNPLYKRIPKKRGFTNIFKVAYDVINLSDLEQFFNDADEVSLDLIYEKGLAKKGAPVKILGNGQLSKKLKLTAHAVSKSAEAKIAESGSVLEILG